MQEQEPANATKLIRVNTPKSLAISGLVLIASISALFLIPRVFAGTRSESWAYLSIGAICIALIRAARNSMTVRAEVDERTLSNAERLSKRKLKILLTSAGYAYLVLTILIVSGPGADTGIFSTGMTWSREIGIGLLALIYVGASIVGHIYMRRFVTKRRAT